MKILLVPVISCLMTQVCLSQTVHTLQDLSAFKDPGKTWRMAGTVTADQETKNTLYTTTGKNLIVNQPGKKDHGADLYTKASYGDIDLELEYMMASGSNSGIYLQGRYELQLHDTWGSKRAASGTNGGIYERWDENRPEGQKGFGGIAPRMNASRASGLWQQLKISFQAPRFDKSGKKIEPAKILSVILNGALIHEDVELQGPTRGAMGDEQATGSLRIQGDHGAVAFRNIKITSFNQPRRQDTESARPYRVYPMNVDPMANPVFRSFMDLPDGTRVIHTASVASKEKVHYTYDMGTGMIIQAWRGDFLDATPMWFSRGDGSARPTGAVLRFGTPVPAILKLTSAHAAWKTDTVSTGYRTKGYILDENERPVFIYRTHGMSVRDASRVLPDGKGIQREISIENPVPSTYIRLASGATIREAGKGLYLIDNSSYYLQLDGHAGEKPVIRDTQTGKELIVPVKGNLKYSILF
jgi:hypothetical protein